MTPKIFCNNPFNPRYSTPILSTKTFRVRNPKIVIIRVIPKLEAKFLAEFNVLIFDFRIYLIAWINRVPYLVQKA